MADPILQIVLIALAAAVLGGFLGWLTRGGQARRLAEQVTDRFQLKLDDTIRQRDRLTTEVAKLRTTIETQQGAIHRHEVAVARAKTEIVSAREKEKQMAKSIFTLRTEREDFKNKLLRFQHALVSVKQRSAELQTEFVKSGEFYKGELAKSFEKRKALEAKLENAKAEYQSSSTLLHSSRSEHESVNRMLESAQIRLSNLDALEQDVIRLEAENAQLQHDGTLAKQQIEVLQRDVAEIDELKVQNRELAHCLESLESSRKQYESDAKRYRDQADQSEQQSETLRIRLDEVELNFSEMEQQQSDALKEARTAAATQQSNEIAAEQQDVDDLQEIIGVGKAFEKTLHDLGIYSFRQIANFGLTDIARVNMELREFKGRMEQDDWIGQAKELYFKKYGGSEKH